MQDLAFFSHKVWGYPFARICICGTMFPPSQFFVCIICKIFFMSGMVAPIRGGWPKHP